MEAEWARLGEINRRRVEWLKDLRWLDNNRLRNRLTDKDYEDFNDWLAHGSMD